MNVWKNGKSLKGYLPIEPRGCRTILFSLGLAIWVTMVSSGFALASLLGESLKEAPNDDFISYFGFVPVKAVSSEADLSDHLFICKSLDASLSLGVEKQGAIRHLVLTMPQEWVSDPEKTIAGRDVARSFVRSIATSSEDSDSLTPLMDEIWVRDLDLHPVAIKAEKFSDTNKPIPKNAYKIGDGPSKVGERVIFIDKMPVLASQASELYMAFIGKKESAKEEFSQCRLSIRNTVQDKQSVIVFDAWDDSFWRSKIGEKHPAAVQSPELRSALSKADEFGRQGNFVSVVAVLKPLSSTGQHDLQYLTALCTALQMVDDNKGAIDVFKQGTIVEKEQESRSGQLHLAAAKAWEALGKQSYAFEESNIASSFAPRDAHVAFEVGMLKLRTSNPLFAGSARKAFETAEVLGLKDYRIPALEAVATIQMGSLPKGLGALKQAIVQMPPAEASSSFAKQMKATADAVERRLRSRAVAPVAAKDRKYTLVGNTAAVIADRDEATGVVTMCLMSGHDPDGGKQDGNDDGIIEFLWEHVNKPDQIYRPK